MSNALIAYRNYADECTLSGGSYTSGLPLTNLQQRQITRRARSTNALAASTQFVAALTRARPLRVLALISSNLSTAATYRFRVYTDAGLTALVYDSGTLSVFPEWMYAYGTLEWEDPRFWDGRPLAEDAQYFSSDVIHPLTQLCLGRYIKCEIVDTANPDGFVELGRLYVGDAWLPTYNMTYGASIGHSDLSTATSSPGGQEYFTEQAVRRTVRFELPWMDEAEAMGQAFDMQRIAKTVNEVLYMWDPDDVPNHKRRSFMGRMAQLDPISHPFLNSNTTAYQIQEVL